MGIVILAANILLAKALLYDISLLIFAFLVANVRTVAPSVSIWLYVLVYTFLFINIVMQK